MKTITLSQSPVRIGTRLMLGMALLVSSLAISSTLALASPKRAPTRAITVMRPKAPGPLAGTPCTPGCDLYATTGTVTLPDSTTAPIWGYATTNTPGSAALPGPVLIVNQGDAVDITLHNIDLPIATSIMIAGQPGAPDTTGVSAGNSKTYSYSAGVLKPGTYLYEAGLVANGPRQAAMGLYGALVVRPAGAPLQAYADPSTTFADEAVLVLSEIDPAFNAAPITFDMTTYAPKYWLINGKGYPNTDPITTDVNSKVLLRYVNAGLQHHSMGLLGLHQTIIATDGLVATHQSKVVAQTIPAGGTLDTIVTTPASAPANAKYALFEAAMHMDNKGVATGGVINFGGMLTFLTIATGSTTPAGPVASNVSLSPNPSNGSAAVTLSATISGSPDQAEYFVDTLGADTTGCAITGSLTSVSVTIPTSGATAPCVDLTTLSSGNHTFYVHGHDTNGWGAVASAVLNLDKTGPAVSNMALTPALTNGTADVQIQATGSDVGTGGQNVTAAEYSIDGGAASALTPSTPASTVSLNGTIAAATVAALSNGNHTVSIRAQDALGNWGALGSTTLKVDKTGPGTSGVSTAPNPTNGLIGSIVGSGGQLYQRIDATVSDPVVGINSNIVAAEYFVDTVGANGTGGAMLPNAGIFNASTSAAVYGLIDLYAMSQITVGAHTVSVHGKDAAGNWGLFATTTLTVDKTGPNVNPLTLSPNPNNGAATMTLNATLTDPPNGAAPGSNIVAAEYFFGATDPGKGLGTPLTIATPSPTVNLTKALNVAGFLTGTYSISVRAQDAATNWGPLVTRPITINQASNSLFADSFESANFAAWSATGGNPARISVTSGGTTSGTQKMQAQVNFGTSGYVQDNTPANEPNYHARFYISPTLTANTTFVNIFVGLTSANAPVFQVQLRRQGTNYQVQVVVFRAGNLSTTSSPPVVLTAGRWHSIEIGWQSTTNSSFRFYTDGVLRQTLTGLNTSTLKLDTVQLGPQPVGGFIPFGLTGTVWFDSFVSTRNTLVGP